MKWLLARAREPSTWGAVSALCFAVGFYLMTEVSWWRDLIYVGAAFAVVQAIKKEQGS
jgi:hypothetical protein